jgi:mRNA interferase HigB
MDIVGKDKLDEFKKSHPDACSQVDSWVAEVEEADWGTPQDIKKRFAKASILPNKHIVFNIRGNRYRLLVQIGYKSKVVLVKKAGTHEEYMKWETPK